MGLRLVGYSVEDFDVIYYTFVSDIEDSPFNAPDGIIIPKSTLSSCLFWLDIKNLVENI